MNTLEINKYGKQLKGFYGGCMGADMLCKQRLRKRSIGYSINLCDSSVYSDECHWVSLIVKVGCIEYFDSSGQSSHITNRHIRKFISRVGRKVIFNKTPIQSLESELCGKFVLCHLFTSLNGVAMRKYTNIFDKKNLNRNDLIVNKLFSCFYENGLKRQ